METFNKFKYMICNTFFLTLMLAILQLNLRQIVIKYRQDEIYCIVYAGYYFANFKLLTKFVQCLIFLQ